VESGEEEERDGIGLSKVERPHEGASTRDIEVQCRTCMACNARLEDLSTQAD
jgi:hypothetical protein